MKITLVVPYYNKWPRTKYLLKSLGHQKLINCNFDVIIVDDGSYPPFDSLVNLKDFSYSIEIIRQNNLGRASARNTGLFNATGDIIVFIDDDIIAPDDYVQSHASHHKNSQEPIYVHNPINELIQYTPFLDPEEGIYFDYIEDIPKIKINLMSEKYVFENMTKFLKYGRVSHLEKLIIEVLKNENLKGLHWIGCVGGSFSIKRETAIQVQGYDPNFKAWGAEDFEFGYRLIKQGVSAKYASNEAVYHISHAHKEPLKERNISQNYFYEKYQDQYIKKLYDYIDRKISIQEFFKGEHK